MAINLKSVFLTCKYAIPEMLKTGGGSIINTSSIAALVGGENAHAYTASKGGMISLSRALAVDRPRNVRVNCICPGVIDTARWSHRWWVSLKRSEPSLPPFADSALGHARRYRLLRPVPGLG